ncbi:NAD+ kinase [Spizellomyces sp. 'palustris']|nr:NAD+ kinase [Spizellomyces sp. 'palustris']
MSSGSESSPSESSYFSRKNGAENISLTRLSNLASPRLLTPTSQLAETAVGVREAAKCIGRALVKLERPQTVMLVAKALDAKIIKFTRQLACHLIDTPRTSCGLQGLTVYIDSKFRTHPAFNFDRLLATHPHYAEQLKFWTPELCATQTDHIDFIITLGGDGTVIYTSWLFQHAQVPPVVPFDLGSLGFLTNFNITNIRDVLQRVIGCRGAGVRVNLRMRLSCTVWRSDFKSKNKEVLEGRTAEKKRREDLCSIKSDEGEADGRSILAGRASSQQPDPGATLNRLPAYSSDNLISTTPAPRVNDEHATSDIGDLLDEISLQLVSKADPEELDPGPETPKRIRSMQSLGAARPSADNPKPVPTETFQILNDLVVDRGPSAYMSQLELFVDDRHLTTVQADGLVLSTPTGSTAYSLSAGGSLVHPEVPSVLVTPICPHTLSFRPMLLPDSTDIRIQVPRDSRTSAWASFDGRHRIELKKGDYVTVTMSRWPMPTVCEVDQGTDWSESLRRCLHWNERTRQKPFVGEQDKRLEKVGDSLRQPDTELKSDVSDAAYRCEDMYEQDEERQDDDSGLRM